MRPAITTCLPELAVVTSPESESPAPSTLQINPSTASSESEADPLATESIELSESNAELVLKKNQPADVPSQQLSNRKLNFQPSWYKIFPWLHFDPELQKIVCHHCVVAKTLGLHSTTAGHEEAFVSTGFLNWKKAKEKFQTHEMSSFHKLSVSLIAARQQTPITSKLEEAKAKEQIKARMFLKVMFTTIMYLGKQGLALRGHENDRGNLMSLLKLRSQDIDGLFSWLNRSKSYSCGEIQNEILGIIAHSVLIKVMKKLNAEQIFSVIVDETTDAATMEQVSINVRIVTNNFEAEEYFLGLYETSSTTGENLFKLIQDALLRFNLPLKNLRGQCYDGAANMSGKFKGVQANFLKEEPRALYAHCFNHSLNLALQDAVKVNVFIREVLTLSHEIGTMIKGSPKRMAQFNQICANADTTTSLRPRPLCPTRWSVRVNSVEAIISSYESILTLLDELASSTDKAASKAQGLKSQMEKAECFIGLLITKTIFTPCERLSKVLQDPSASVYGGQEAAVITVAELIRLKTETEFENLWAKMEEKQNVLGLSHPVLPRRRGVPKRLRNFEVPREFMSAKERLCSFYFSAIEILCEEINNRFSQPNLNMYVDCEKLLISFGNGMNPETFHGLQEVCNFYEWNFGALISQLEVLRNVKNMEWNSVGEIIQCFKRLTPETRALFPDVGTYLKHLLVVPCSSAGAERSFSMVRRVKTYLRSTMGQSRLNHCCVINAYADEVDDLDIDEMMQIFICKGVNREVVFGKNKCL